MHALSPWPLDYSSLAGSHEINEVTMRRSTQVRAPFEFLVEQGLQLTILVRTFSQPESAAGHLSHFIWFVRTDITGIDADVG